MKKLLSICLVVCMALTMLFTLIACKPQHEHQLKRYWSKDEVSHWKECSDPACKEKFETADHVWDEGETVFNATPAKPGQTQFECTVCKATKKENTPYVPNSVVDQDAWIDALLLSGHSSITIKTTVEGEEKPQIAKTKISNNYISYDADDTTIDGQVNMYVKDNDENYYLFMIVYQIIVGDMYTFRTYRTAITQNNYEKMRHVFDYLENEYQNFTYDQESGTYKLAQLQVDSEILTNVELTFADGVVAKISYNTKTEDNKTALVEYDFVYHFYRCSTCYTTVDTLLNVGDTIDCETCAKNDKRNKMDKNISQDPFGFVVLTQNFVDIDLDNPPAEEGGNTENAG